MHCIVRTIEHTYVYVCVLLLRLTNGLFYQIKSYFEQVCCVENTIKSISVCLRTSTFDGAVKINQMN